jgi:hypothetical protein
MAEITIPEPLSSEIAGVARRLGKSPKAMAERALREFLDRQQAEDLLTRSSRIDRKSRFPISQTENLVRAIRATGNRRDRTKAERARRSRHKCVRAQLQIAQA